jgi:hypothetical protein
MPNAQCTYDQMTERYTICDGHDRCICPPRHSSSDSNAVLIAEISRLRAQNKDLANLVSTITLACERGVVGGIDGSWVREAWAALGESKC